MSLTHFEVVMLNCLTRDVTLAGEGQSNAETQSMTAFSKVLPLEEEEEEGRRPRRLY